ncbi:MAG: hydroxyacid dehydrogenase, partial [Treponema sp.]|nr:hydroxyacid dehydrogenase [Treponema sp.]
TDNDFKLLDDKGSRSRIQTDKEVEQIYLEFDKRRKEYEAKEAEKQDEQELKALEEAEKKLLGRKK